MGEYNERSILVLAVIPYVRFMVQTPARRVVAACQIRSRHAVRGDVYRCFDAAHIAARSCRLGGNAGGVSAQRGRFLFFFLFDSAPEIQRVRSRKRRRKKGRRGGFLRSSAKHDFSFTEPRRLLILPSKKKKKKTKM